ncbi:MAG: hypothetical protein R2762_01260 [Bryobacteraceae bacterium]
MRLVSDPRGKQRREGLGARHAAADAHRTAVDPAHAADSAGGGGAAPAHRSESESTSVPLTSTLERAADFDVRNGEVRQLQFALGSPGQDRVQVSVHGHGPDIEMAVGSADSQLNESLRSGLEVLVENMRDRMRESGHTVEAWLPAEGAPRTQAAAASDRQPGGESDTGDRREWGGDGSEPGSGRREQHRPGEERRLPRYRSAKPESRFVIPASAVQ